jgi:hypothetical protein
MHGSAFKVSGRGTNGALAQNGIAVLPSQSEGSTRQRRRTTMIVRGEQNGSLVLINQTDHSQLVGQLAAHWGNSEFATPRPYESVVRAAIYHDFGWLPYETGPSCDPKTGKPFNFLQIGLQSSQLEAYRWVIDWMNTLDPYSALIMSMHRTGLWRGRYGAISHPTAFNLTNPPPNVAKFTADNEKWQAEQGERFDQKELRINYQLMQVWDLLGLYFCCNDPGEEYVEPVPRSYTDHDGKGVRLSMAPSGGGSHRIVFEPYPFDIRPLKVQVRAKRLSNTTFQNDAEFRKAYFQAENSWMEFELV